LKNSGRRYGFAKPRLVRLFTAVDALGELFVAPLLSRPPTTAPARILLVNLAHIGDVVMTSPAIALLRQAHPEAHLAMLVGPWSEGAVARNPRLDDILVRRASWWDRQRGSPYFVLPEFLDLVRTLRGHRFDLAVNFKSFFQENLACALAGIPRRVGFDLYGGGFLQTVHVPFPWGAHTVEQHLALASAACDRTLEAPDPRRASPPLEIFTAAADEQAAAAFLTGVREPLVAIHLGSGAPARIWPVQRYAELADRLAERFGVKIVLVGGADDAALIEEFRRRARHPALLAAGRLDVPQTTALLRRCRLLIGNNSGPVHLAAAAGIPTLAVFSGTNAPCRSCPSARSVVCRSAHARTTSA
jgi:ADP-heptose:LPS heptosyltransferase